MSLHEPNIFTIVEWSNRIESEASTSGLSKLYQTEQRDPLIEKSYKKQL